MTTPVTASKPLLLASLHQRLGAAVLPLAELGLEGGAAVPARYGPVAEEHAALALGCAFLDLSWAGRLELLGADRQRFLNGLVTCEVKGLAPGQGAYGFVTSAQGRILADL